MRRSSYFILAIVVATAVCLAQSEGPNMPEDPRAKAALKRAMRLFEERDLDDAVAELEAGYAIEPKPIFMFSLATVERYRDNCERAITLYRCYLASNPPKTAKAIDGLKECGTAYNEPAEGECDGVLKTVATTAPPPDQNQRDPGSASNQNTSNTTNTGRPGGPPPEGEPRSWYQDPLGDILFGVGLASVATGASFFYLGNKAAKDANEANSLDRYRELDDRASSRRLVGWIATGAGGALMIGGIVRWLTLDDGADQSSSVSFLPTADGAAVVFGGRF
ncbi:MAG: hypothetical protein KJO07_12810 [Deltaproteobacteria bacterium]|nr:hypothetical protein [Deltaproteobacteria bacterium]